LKYTTNKFYRVNGASTQLNGVEPDIVLPSTYEFMELLGEKSLDNALPSGMIESADYEKVNRVQQYTAELKKRSATRLSSEKDYSYVREDIEQVKKMLSDKSISLNEQARLKEVQDNETRQKARELELKARKWPDAKIYELTLQHVDDPILTPTFVISNGSITTNKAAGTTTAKDPETSIAQVDAADEEPPSKLVSPADLSPEERAPMVEAQRILLDYITLWNANPPLAVRHQQN